MRKAMRAFSVVLALMGIVLLVSCGDPDSASGNMSINEVKTVVFKSDFPEMVELGKSQLSNYYTFEEEWLEEFSVYIADSETASDEVGIFRLTSDDYTKDVVAAIEQRVNTQISMFNKQNEVEISKLGSRVLLQKGDIIVLVISQFGEDIADRLEEDYGFSEIVIQ